MLETTLDRDGSAKTATIPEFKGYAVKTGTVGFDENQDLYYDKEHTQYYGKVKQVGKDLIATDQWMSGVTKSVAISVWTGFDDQAIYGDWLDSQNQGRASVMVNALKYFNKGKDTSQFDFDQTVVEITKKEAPKKLELLEQNKIIALINNELKIPNLALNTIKASDEQKQFQSSFELDQLTGEYKGIKPFYDANNSLRFGLVKSGKAEKTKIYKVNESGEIVEE